MLRNCIVYDKEEIKERKICVYVEFVEVLKLILNEF